MRKNAVLAFLAALLLAAPAVAQKSAPAYKPAVGQDGKDVVWVPSPQAVVDRMLDMAKVGPGDSVIDLGSGDGRTVITAARRGVPALGIEYNPDLVELSRRNAEKEGVAERASFMKADLFEADFSRFTVISIFLAPELNKRLLPKLLALKPGTRIVTNSFGIGEWKPDQTVVLKQDQGCKGHWCTAHLWVVPARAAGTHRIAEGELVLRQDFQFLSGTLRTRSGSHPVTGRVNGEEIAFSAGGREYRGKVEGGRLALR